MWILSSSPSLKASCIWSLSNHQSSPSWMKAADEEVRMQEGELWWFDNDQMHEAFNDGDEDRIHMIFDLLPRERASEAFSGAASSAVA
ncbi:MAG: aspartyl/asparaginyl beta-hydroxylase domain-containing protein [Pseudomonadota bacterium]